MPTFVLMTRLDSSSLKDADARRKTGHRWLEKVTAACPDVKWLAHYAILGPYDFMDIYEANDVESAQRVALISRSQGAVCAETWPAIPYERFMRVLHEID